MVENSVTIKEAETGPEAPQVEPQDNQSERPEWLPEKFKTAEDMAKSYSELEKKFSSGTKQEEATAEPEASTEETPPTDNSLAKFSDEYASKGELSEDSFSELEKMGYPKEMVETYINGVKSNETADVNAVMEIVGGDDGYKDLTGWAKENMPTNELELYNQMVAGSTDNAKMAVEWLMSKRESAEGSEPSLVQGKPQGIAKDTFRSTQEVISAMKDPRYGKDSAYTKDIELKVGRSNVF